MNARNISKITFIIILLTFGVFALIIVMLISDNLNSKLYDIDTQQEIYAEHQASIEYQKNYKPFTAVFDTETKQFVDKRTARMSVKPYGSSKEHQGMYLLITVDKDGNISSQWISP